MSIVNFICYVNIMIFYVYLFFVCIVIRRYWFIKLYGILVGRFWKFIFVDIFVVYVRVFMGIFVRSRVFVNFFKLFYVSFVFILVIVFIVVF